MWCLEAEGRVLQWSRFRGKLLYRIIRRSHTLAPIATLRWVATGLGEEDGR